MEFMRLYYCENPKCSNFHEKIFIKPRLLEHDYYEWPNVYCVCGFKPKELEVN